MKPAIEKTITVAADIEKLSEFRQFIQKQGGRSGVSEDTLFDLALAVDEACTNIISHGHEGLSPGEIVITITVNEDRVVITILDHGRPFDPQQTPEPDINIHWQERKIGGLGWHLIKEMTDEATYHSDSQKGNRLVLVKKIK